MKDVKIVIIGEDIVFNGYNVAKINKNIPSSIMGDFEEKIKGLDIKGEELEKFEEIIYELKARISDIDDTTFDLERLINKIRG